MVTPLAAPTFSMVALSSFASNSLNRQTMFRGSTHRSLRFNTNYKRNVTPASPPPLERHLRPPDMNVDASDNERPLEHGLAFQQNFEVRSFEIGSDFKISLEALMNYLQDAAVNHTKSLGIMANGTLGATSEMSARDLVWVVCGLDLQVDYYPSWADVVQVETWIYKSGRNSVSREWRVRDFNTGKTLIRAASLAVTMNKKTRKFVKLSEEVIKDLMPFLVQRDHHIHKSSRKLPQLDTNEADYVRTALTPRWSDMDINQHVSHIKLINYVLESVPPEVVVSHRISTITLDYRKECNRDSVLQSFSSVTNRNRTNELMDSGGIEFDHLLCLECGREIVRGRSKWKPKCEDN